MAEKLDLKIYGKRGLAQWGGKVQEEFLRDLQYARRYRTYREMLYNDPVLGAVFRLVDLMCRQVPWNAEPADDTPEAQEGADFLESCLGDMSDSWQNTLTEILTFIPYGFSVHELVYKRRQGEVPPGYNASRPGSGPQPSQYDDGKIGWAKIPIRAQDTISTWDFDDSGELQGLAQRLPNSYETAYIPYHKLLLFRAGSHKGNPEGMAVLRNAFRPWYFKQNLENILGIGVERDLAGYPIIEGDPEILKAFEDEFKEIVTNIRRDEQEGVVLPAPRDDNGDPLVTIKLLSTGGQRQFDVKSIIEYYDQRLAMTVLADFLLIGHEKVGSFALSSSKTNVFAIALGAYLDEITSVFNRHAIPRLWRLNGFDMDTMPQLVHGDIEKEDMEQWTKALLQASQAGFIFTPSPDGRVERHVAEKLDLPYIDMELQRDLAE